MKPLRILLIIIFSCLSFSVFTQDEGNKLTELQQKQKKETVEIFRDRLIIDIYHSFWMGTPEMVKSKFNPGFNVALLWDFKASKKSPISFGLGLGCTFHTQFSDAHLKYNETTGITKYHVLPPTVSHKDSMKLNRITYINYNIPLELRYRHKNGFRFTVGVRLGLIGELSQRYKGKNIDGKHTDDNYKYFLKTNRQKFNFDAYMRCGWKFVSVYYSYQVNKLYSDGKGPAVTPMSVGISLSPF